MAVNLGFPLVGMQVPGLGMEAPRRRSWQERLFDRLAPESSASLVGVSGADKKALVRQGLLQLAANLQAAPTLGQGLTQGLLAGSQSLNQGVKDIQARRLREQQIQHQLAGPQGFREFAMTAEAAGLKPGTSEYQRAARVGLGLDPRAVTGAARTLMVKGADGRERPGTWDPTTRTFSVYDEASNSFRPLGVGESVQEMPAASPMGGTVIPTQGATQPMFGQRMPDEQIIATANQMAQAGMPPEQIETWMRSQQSQPLGVSVASPMRQTARPGLAVGRAPEEQAFATESAQQAAQIAALPQRNALEVQLAGQKAAVETAAKATAERQQEAISALPTVLSTSGQIDSLLTDAIKHPGRATATGMSGQLDPRNYLRGTDASDFAVLLDQIKGQAFLQAFQSLRGSGAITEREGQAATNAIARLNTAQSDEAFVKALKDLQQINKNAQQRAIEKARGGQAAPQAAPKTIRYDARGNRLP